MYKLFSAFFPILKPFSLKPLTRNHSYIMVYYIFLIRVCDDHSATWHFYLKRFLNLFHEYQNVKGTLQLGKTCSANFSCHDLDTADGKPVLNGMAVVNVVYII